LKSIGVELSPRNLEPIADEYSISSTETVLDAGCGYGGRSLRIGKDFGSHVISIDLSLSCLKSVKSAKKLQNIDLINADVQYLPLKDSSIDKIVCADVLEHVPDVSFTLRGFEQTLKKGGLIFLLVPSRVSERLYSRLDNKYIEHKDHLRTFIADEFFGLVQSGGFRVVNIYHAEFFRAVYHLLQVLTGSRFEHQTGRPIEEDAGLSAVWRISRLLYYSWVGSLVEAIGRFILPNSLVVVAAKKS
jgi:cyclopropane fatty-acyl-phospholipid synthase-like methyltransferase